VLDSSAHVTYRNRTGIMEITIRRGAVRQEFQQLLNKLQMHRISAWGSYVTLIKGTKRFRLGRLADINLSYLQSLIEECTDQYGNCGIEIAESGSKAGAGALYKGGVHGSRFKSKSRRGKGIYNASVKTK
jgi:predicted transcriptional regulator